MSNRQKPDRAAKRARHRRQKRAAAGRTWSRLFRLRTWGELSSEPVTMTEVCYRLSDVFCRLAADHIRLQLAEAES